VARRHRGLAPLASRTPGPRRRLLASCAFASALLAPALAHAQLVADPTGSQFSSGGAAPLVGVSGRTTDITLGAQRTIMNWSSYALASDQTVVYRFGDRGWIVLNRVSGPAMIDGQIEALVGNQRGGGNVWFSSPGGVIFGPNAKANVGGLLATSATVATSGFLSGGSSFDFSGGGSGRVEVRSGAEIKSGGGPIALIAGNVVTQSGATITGGDGSSILYGAASDFTVRFGTVQGDLDLLDFIVPASGGTASTTPLSLQGQTVGANVFLASVSRTEVASAVISAPGLIAAQSAAADRGDVVLTAGVSIVNRQPGGTRLNTTTETTASFGVVTAQRDLLGGFGSPTVVTGGQFAAGRDLGVAAASLDVGLLNAGRLLAVDASRGITIRTSSSAGAAASFRTAGAFTVGGGTGGVNAIGRLQIDASTVQAGRLDSGRSIVVNASGAGANGAAAVNVGAALAEDDITITTTNAAGHIVLGQAALTGARSDEAPAGRNLTLTARGAQADVSFGAPAGSALTGASAVNLSAGRDVTANVSGLLTLANGSAGRTFTIRAGDLDITGPLTAQTLRIESLAGALTLGGGSSSAPAGGAAAGVEGLRITDAEFQRLQVSGQTGFYAGSPNGTARGDLVVLDLNITPSRVANLVLAAGGANDIRISGVIAPTVSGGTLTVGDTATTGFAPGRILLSGSIGFSTGSPDAGFTGVRAFDEVGLNAQRDIIMGSARFIALVNGLAPSQIDIAHDMPSGVAPVGDEIGHIFLTAGVLGLSAQAKIVQENTGTPARGNGFYLANIAAAPRDTVLTVTTAQVVDLFGSLRDKNGVLRSGSSAARAIQVTGFGGGTPSLGATDLRFNGTETRGGGLFGGGDGSASSPIDVAAQGTTQVASVIASTTEDSGGLGDDSGGDAGDSDEGGTSVGPSPDPALISIATPSVTEITGDPIEMGSGNDEVWRSKRPK
jgi:filamentous hemagglutinin family protein